MPRNLDSTMLTELQTNAIRPAFAAIIKFKSETVYVWTGSGNLVYGGNTYLGVGSFGKIGSVVEGSDVNAYGTSITLSGIDPTLLSESLTDIQIGAPATIYFILLDSLGDIYGVPYPLFVGTVDKPSITMGMKTLSITLNLENRLSDLQRANMRKYTSADQRLYYPLDDAFNFVEELNDQALRWT
jgi:hypothetical protein